MSKWSEGLKAEFLGDFTIARSEKVIRRIDDQPTPRIKREGDEWSRGVYLKEKKTCKQSKRPGDIKTTAQKGSIGVKNGWGDGRQLGPEASEKKIPHPSVQGI